MWPWRLSTLSGAVVQVLPPGSGAPITAIVESTVAVGTTDSIGDAKSFVVTYQITPPGGAWTSADNGNYTVTLSGGTVTDLAGNAVASRSLGTFSVSVGRTVTVHEANGSIYQRTYNADGSSTATLVNSSGRLLDSYTYNASGQFTSYTTYEANGNVYQRIFNADGSSTATLKSSSGVLLDSYTYNASGQFTSYTTYETNGNVYQRIF